MLSQMNAKLKKKDLASFNTLFFFYFFFQTFCGNLDKFLSKCTKIFNLGDDFMSKFFLYRLFSKVEIKEISRTNQYITAKRKGNLKQVYLKLTNT